MLVDAPCSGLSVLAGRPDLRWRAEPLPDLQLELWLEDNERALPRRFIITYLSLPGRPRFIAALSHWDFDTQHADADFVFKPPAGAKQVELAQRAGAQPKQSSEAPKQ